MGTYCDGCQFYGGGDGTGVGGGSVVVIVGMVALVMDFREVMMTSPPELAHYAPSPPGTMGHFRESSYVYLFF